MARQRTIVGIGEAMLAEYPDREQPSGIALGTAIQATLLGQRGIPISRLGQDALGEDLLKLLREFEVDCSHLQSDPDLPTARLVVRSIGGKTTRSLDPQAAFDNLQWDFDLEDVAHQADAVVFGVLARRSNQSSSTIERMLGETRAALRVMDLTNRDGVELTRDVISVANRYAECLVLDQPAVNALLPAMHGKAARDGVIDLLRQCDLAFAVMMGHEQPIVVHTAEGETVGKAPSACNSPVHDATIVALVHAVLCGAEFTTCVAYAESIAEHAAAHGYEPVPENLREPIRA